MRLKPGAVVVPQLREEWVEVEALGGEVLIRGLTLSQAFKNNRDADGHTGRMIALTLHAAVFGEGDDGPVPLMSLDEWERWGGDNLDAAVRLFNECHRVSGGTLEEAGKD